jgi:cell division protein FtsB
MNIFRSWSKKVGTAVGVLLLLILAVDFNSRMVHMLELRGEMDVEQARLDELLKKEEVLRQAIEFAESDEAIDEWAREENWMALEGDVVVVPISDGTVLEEERVIEVEPQEYLSNWDSWILWLTYRE